MSKSSRQAASEAKAPRLGMPVACACLWMAVVGSSLGVVYSTFATRQATHQLEDLRRQAADLQVDSGKYLLEKGTLAAYTRVEVEAETQLDMVVPAIESLEMVRR